MLESSPRNDAPSRREFVNAATAMVGTLLGSAPALGASRLSPNDLIRTAGVGLRGGRSSHIAADEDIDSNHVELAGSNGSLATRDVLEGQGAIV